MKYIKKTNVEVFRRGIDPSPEWFTKEDVPGFLSLSSQIPDGHWVILDEYGGISSCSDAKFKKDFMPFEAEEKNEIQKKTD